MRGPKKLAEWWVILNCWEWPQDMPHPPNQYVERRSYIRGAHSALEAVGVDMKLVDDIWQDEGKRRALVERNAGVGR